MSMLPASPDAPKSALVAIRASKFEADAVGLDTDRAGIAGPLGLGTDRAFVGSEQGVGTDLDISGLAGAGAARARANEAEVHVEPADLEVDAAGIAAALGLRRDDRAAVVGEAADRSRQDQGVGAHADAAGVAVAERIRGYAAGPVLLAAQRHRAGFDLDAAGIAARGAARCVAAAEGVGADGAAVKEVERAGRDDYRAGIAAAADRVRTDQAEILDGDGVGIDPDGAGVAVGEGAGADLAGVANNKAVEVDRDEAALAGGAGEGERRPGAGLDQGLEADQQGAAIDRDEAALARPEGL